jgi:hypothetical protein
VDLGCGLGGAHREDAQAAASKAQARLLIHRMPERDRRKRCHERNHRALEPFTSTGSPLETRDL